MKKIFFLLLFFQVHQLFCEVEVKVPHLIVEGIETEITINRSNPNREVTLFLGEEEILLAPFDQSTTVLLTFERKEQLSIISEEEEYFIEINPIPQWLSLLPPLIAILLALVFREVITSLLIGIFIGSFTIYYFSDGFLQGLVLGFMSTIDHYILNALNNESHLSIIIFSMLIGGMVSVISKNGGMQGIVNRISKYATNAKNGQLATWFLGIAIFFDDYANTLIVGNTMRPITDRLKISREKLAYLVDSTAAPIASIAFITTWIGAELGYIESGINQIEGLEANAYSTFLSSLAYSFYPILAILFMLILILKEKDFGLMLTAEKKARKKDLQTDAAEENNNTALKEFDAKKGIVQKPINAILPILTVIIGTVTGLLITGWDKAFTQDESLSLMQKLASIIGNADSYQALLWSSFASIVVAVLLSTGQKLLSLQDAIESIIHGFKTMLPAITILILAWSLAILIEEMHTATFLTSMLSDNVSPYFLPAITFVLSALVAFSTGSSWGTMAILYPIMIPSAWSISEMAGLDVDITLGIFHNVIACVLAGSVLGDHCSPISDTTILSSLASSCNHIDHVKTQMPYALTVGLVSILLGTIPAAFGIPFWLSFVAGVSALYLIVQWKGKKSE